MDPLRPKAIWGFNGTERPGAELCGRLVTAEIGIPAPENWEAAEILDEALLASLLPERPRDAHKLSLIHI